MFKSARWKSEKNKIKAVFKLQFQATQVPQLKARTLTVSLVPAEVGKPTVRLEKAVILDGTCSWEDPVYETMKLVRELKTGRFNDKFYHFIVSTGSSKIGPLGEVSINFADYAEAAQPSTVSLPLKTSQHGGTGAILHVTIHNIQSLVDQSYIEGGESLSAKSQDRSFKNQLMDHDRNGYNKLNCVRDENIKKLDSEDADHTRSFKSFLEEKPSICQEDTIISQDSMPQQRRVDAFLNNSHMYRRSKTDWSVDSASNETLVDLPNSAEENLPRDRSPVRREEVEKMLRAKKEVRPSPNISVEKLVREISMLDRQAELSELEIQSLRKQIVKESKRGQDLSRQIVSLKEERDELETQCEQFKSFLDCSDVEISKETEHLRVILEEIKLELNHEKDVNTALRLQLQKTEDSNSELILAVRDLDELLEQKTREIADLSTITKSSRNNREAAKEVVDCNKESKEVSMLTQNITDLHSEIEVYKKDREELMMHMEQLATDHETLMQENHDITLKLEQNGIEQTKMQNQCSEHWVTLKEFEIQVGKLEKEIKKQALQLSESSGTINGLETQVKFLEAELEKQAQRFEDDLEGIRMAKTEQEKWAIQAEDALRKARSNNAIMAERCQEEFRSLSAEMSSKFDENEKLRTKAVAEANHMRLEKRVLEEMLHKAIEELGLVKEQYEEKLQELSNQTDVKSEQIEQISQELAEKCVEIEHLKKQEEDTEIQKLKGEIERLKNNNEFSEQQQHKERKRDDLDGMELMKILMSEQVMVQRWSKEREELQTEFALVKKEAQNLQDELNTLRSLKDEKETRVKILQSDIVKLRVQYNELEHCELEVELEKENLAKAVYKLEGDQRKKEEEIIINTDQKQKRNNKQARNAYIKQIASKDNKSAPLSRESAKNVVREKLNSVEEARLPEKLAANAREPKFQLSGLSSTASTFKEGRVDTTPVKSEVEPWSVKGLKLSPFPINDDRQLTELLSEMALLKERNKQTEGELKEMRERYSEVSLKFAEVEGERQQLVMTVRTLKNTKKN